MLKRSIVSILITVITKSIEPRNVSVIPIGGHTGPWELKIRDATGRADSVNGNHRHRIRQE